MSLAHSARPWSAKRIPNLDDKVFVITGANSGLGYDTTLALSQRGARIIMACRSIERGQTAIDVTRAHAPRAKLEVRALDLSSLASVRAFAATLLDEGLALAGLINNAGIMAIPQAQTADGFEMQLGTNHFGHFLLTAQLLPLLVAGEGRVVNVASQAHRMGSMDFDDLHWREGYDPWRAYGRSKLANLLFTFELDRRLRAKGLPVIATASHPGYAATNLQSAPAKLGGSKVMDWLMQLGNSVLAQSSADGALPSLFAAVADDVHGGDYFGPSGLGELRGPPTRVRASPAAYDEALAQQLWQASNEATGAQWPLLA